MRRSREEAARTRQRIVEAASRLFRARGLDAVSVADVMSSLGLTVGGFYRHFDSKEALVIEAIAFSSEQSTSRKGSAEQLIDGYLSMAHRDERARGCPVAALCSEAPKQGRPVQKAFGRAVADLVCAIQAAVPGCDRERAVSTAAEMVGALMLARATPDEKLAREILETAKSAIKRRAGRPRRD
jgi:TetR/AcrR family transcriptional repressor of nem operon